MPEDAYRSNQTRKYVSIDAAFGSSDLGIIVAEWRDNKLNILYENSVNRQH